MAAFQALGVDPVTVLLNDRSLLYALLNQAHVPAEKHGQACLLLDKLDRVPAGRLLEDLGEALGSEVAKNLEPIIFAPEPNLEGLARAEPEAVGRLKDIRQILGPVTVKIAPVLVRGFDYYTGTVFEFRHPKFQGSIGGGGRYDRLTEKFGGAPVPACGGSIGFERLMLLLEESTQGGEPSGPQACLMVFSDELKKHSLNTAARLRAAGWEVDVYAGTGKLKAQFKYADQRRARLALVIGPEEAAVEKIKVKDMKTGEERIETIEELLRRGPQAS
jgi:histidyl-tRNA synthetase